MVESNRREFLKNAGAIGLSYNIVNLDDNLAKIGDMAFDPDDEVAYIAGWSNKVDDNGDVKKDPMYKTMSHEKWANLQATADAAQLIGEALEDSSSDKNQTGLIIESLDDASETGRRLDVGVVKDTHTEKLSNIPDEAVGKADILNEEYAVPVGLAELEFDDQDHECYPTPYEEFDDVSGGSAYKGASYRGG